MTDSLFADVSEFQGAVDDTYPYRILSLRSNDGTYQDHNFAQNYAWAVNAVNTGRLSCFIVYMYWRPDWLGTVNTHKSMVAAAGGLHPKMIVMLDVESGGNPGGDQSDGINRAYWNLADWLGSPQRVIGYANEGDFHSMWRTRPDGLRVIGAGYGINPNLPGQIAHQYSDGVYSNALKAARHNHTTPGLERAVLRGRGSELPLGALPFGHCDMNSADGLSATDFAAACGEVSLPQPQETNVSVSDDELSKLFPSRSKYRVDDSPVDTLAGFVLNVDARVHEVWVEREAWKGERDALTLVARQAAQGDTSSQAVLDQIARAATNGDVHAQAVLVVLAEIRAAQ